MCDCGGIIKPDIVFFGENLPRRFFEGIKQDFPKCDLLLVVGTSLQVHPFAGLIREVSGDTPRILINREAVGVGYGGFEFEENAYRDVALLGDLQDISLEIAGKLGWSQDLEELYSQDEWEKRAFV